MGKNQLFTSVASFAASLAIWTLMFGGNLVPAMVLMVVLLIHEMGHYIAARLVGTEAELPVFMVLGAFVRHEPSTLRNNFIISAAGPVVGAAAAFVMLFLGGPLLVKAAALGLILNLFQLIPVPPFDGGHMTLAIDRRLWKVGAIFVTAYAAVCLLRGDFMPALFVFLMWDQTRAYMANIEAQADANPSRFEVPAFEKAIYSLVYFGLTGGLIFVCWSLGITIL